MTKISVALCTYNGEKYLRKQMDSILSQSLQVDEIVVCDDCSTDETQNILADYQHQFPDIITIHFNEKNLRSVKNFEKAVSLCSGDFIFLSDQDDIWNSNKVEISVGYLQKNPQTEVLCSNGFIIDEHSQKQEVYTVWDVPKFLQETKHPIDYFKIFSTIGNFATGAAMVMRKEFVKTVLPFPTVPGLHHDEWIAMASSADGKFDFINEKLLSYRIHSEQQVGGICHPKNPISKEKLISRFDYDKTPESFRDFKIKLRTLNDKERKFNSYLENNSDSRIKKLLKNVQKEKNALMEQLSKDHFFYSLFFKYLYR